MNSHENTQAYHKMDFLEAILDASDGGIMVLDKNGSVLFACIGSKESGQI